MLRLRGPASTTVASVTRRAALFKGVRCGSALRPQAVALLASQQPGRHGLSSKSSREEEEFEELTEVLKGFKHEVKHELRKLQDDQRKGIQEILAELGRVADAVDVVRRTVISLDQAKMPMVFIIEPAEKVALPDAFKRLKVFGDMLDPSSTLAQVKQAIDDVNPQRLQLRLICQATGAPVGDGYTITTPRDVLPSLLPLLKAGVLATKVGAGAVELPWRLSVALGFPGTRELPQDLALAVEGFYKSIEGTNDHTCVAEAAALAGERVGATTGSAARKVELSQFQQQEFKNFLQENDPNSTWAKHLKKVVLDDGLVIWVSPSAEKKELVRLSANSAIRDAGAKSAAVGARGSGAGHQKSDDDGSGKTQRTKVKVGGACAIIVLIVVAVLYYMYREAEAKRNHQKWQTIMQSRKKEPDVVDKMIADGKSWWKKTQRKAKARQKAAREANSK